jgi:hypothetical protein
MLEQQYDTILGDAQSALNAGLGHAKATILVLLAVILVLGISGALVLRGMCTKISRLLSSSLGWLL